MVRGLDKFREYFSEFDGSYVVIGGTACDIILGEAGLTPRATKDIDLVIIVEALNKDFVKRFWEFVEDGRYGAREKGMEERKHYRFRDPAMDGFPQQLELFSRVPDLIELGKDAHLTPIPVDKSLSSLSAILMNDDYYRLTITECSVNDGLMCASAGAIICLKAKAFKDLTERKKNKEEVSDKEIKKHKHDVFRMALTLTEETSIKLPDTVRNDLYEFVEHSKTDLPGPEIFKSLGTGPTDPRDLIAQMERTFGLDLSGGSPIERKIAAVKRRLTGRDVATTKLGAEVLSKTVSESIVPLLRELEKNCEILKEDLFNEQDRQITLQIGGGNIQVATKHTTWPEIESTLMGNLAKRETNLFMSGIDYNYQLRGFKKNLTFNYMTTWLQFQFSEFSYSIRLNQDYQTVRNYSYDAPLDKAEIDVIVGILIDKLLEQISEAGGLKGKV